jgi:hypothetical protein|uniref:Uncharacterized protein n=1 Tax=Siphoviridae sp. ctGa111 TaxID=2825413 RepID=A0A8S5VE45_9CAUD|nr:MAG TPA: hypothetical protein [Siphoviridae sp. ctGa111]
MIDLKEYKRMVVADKAEDVADWIRMNDTFLTENEVMSHPGSMADLLDTMAYVLRGRQS